MRVALIKPPVSAEVLYGRMKDLGNYQQPLGLGYLASYMNRKGHTVRIIDAQVLNLSFKEIIRQLTVFRPEIIGISSNTLDFSTSVRLAKEIKKCANVPIILGGPHVSAIPEDAMAHDCFDIGVLGEGEETLNRLIESFKNGAFSSLDKMDGISYRRGNEIIIKKQTKYIENLDELPFPARHLLPSLAKYKPTPASAMRVPLGSIITSRGCPYQCTYCDRSVFGGHVRFRSPVNIINEIIELKERYGAREFRVWDDVFNLNPKRVIEFCQGLIRARLGLPWSCIVRLNLVDKEQAYWLRRAGCWQVSAGIESGNDKILQGIKKGLTTQLVREKVSIIARSGIQTRGFFMMGMPGENPSTVMDTIRLAKSLPLDDASFYFLTPFPNTEIASQMKEKITSWDDLRQGDSSYIAFCPPGLTRNELKDLYNLAFRSFYLRPSLIFRKLKNIRSTFILKSYLAGFKSLIRL